MYKHWLIHMGRVQLLAIILSMAILVVSSTTGFNTDQPVTYTSKWATGSRLILRVPALSQLPALHNGCEVTSLAMLLDAVHIHQTILSLAKLVQKDPTPLTLGSNGQIVRWGNPNVGFVGSVSGKYPGYAVYHRPIYDLLNRLDPGQALDLTGSPFARILSVVASGRPAVVWTTLTFSPVHNWIGWQSPEGPVRASLFEHTVLLVGFDNHYVYVNNPLNGDQAEPVPMRDFKNSWLQMGSQAVSVKSVTV